MIKKAIVLLGTLSCFAYSQSEGNYTYVFSSLSNLENAETFISQKLRGYDDVRILKYRDKYRVTYGNFKSKAEANSFKQTLPNTLKKLNPFLVEIDNPTINTKSTQQTSMQTSVPSSKLSKVERTEQFTLDATKEDVDNYINQIGASSKTASVEQKSTGLKLGMNIEYSGTKTKNNLSYGSDQKINSNDLALDKTSNSYSPTVYVKNGNHKYQASFFKNSDKGTLVTNKDLRFDNYRYSAGDSLVAKSDTNWVNGGYKYLYKDLAIGADLHNYRNKSEISSVNNKTTLKNDFIFPSLSMDMKHKINDFSVLYGGDYGTLGNKLKYYKYYAGVGVNDLFFNNLDLNLGYKNRTIDIEDNKYDGKTEFSGAYVELNKEF